jgi:hypothetical protein
MRLEEYRILPLAEKYITAAEWHAMASESDRTIPQARVPLVFGMTFTKRTPKSSRKLSPNCHQKFALFCRSKVRECFLLIPSAPTGPPPRLAAALSCPG